MAELGRGIWGKGMERDELEAGRAGRPWHGNIFAAGGFYIACPPRPHFVTFPFPGPKFPCQTRLSPPSAPFRAVSQIIRARLRPLSESRFRKPGVHLMSATAMLGFHPC